MQHLGRQERVVVLGAGGHGDVIAWTLACQGRAEVACFLDDREELHGTLTRSGQMVVGACTSVDLVTDTASHFVVAIGDNRARADRYAGAMDAGLVPWAAIHPSAVIAAQADIGAGLQAVAAAIVNPWAAIGENVILNTGCIVEHDCVVGSHSVVAQGVRLGEGVEVGEYAFLCIGVLALPGVTIGAGTTVAAGAVVETDLPANVVAAGAPAHVVGPAKRNALG